MDCIRIHRHIGLGCDKGWSFVYPPLTLALALALAKIKMNKFLFLNLLNLFHCYTLNSLDSM